MLKFKKDGRTLGVLKDNASEPEGDIFKFREGEEPDTEKAEQQEEADNEELEDAAVE